MAQRTLIQQQAAFNRRREAGLLARTLPRVIVRYKLWIDDMSGVRSKKYCPFLNVRMVFAGTSFSPRKRAVPSLAHRTRARAWF